MKVLLVHQSFPSQLVAVLEALERRDGIECAGIGMNAYARPGLRYRRYQPVPVAPTGDIILDDLAVKVRAAEGAAAAARSLGYDGFVPDLILAHPGWGEALFLKDIFPRARLVCFCEYYYLRTGGELDFDPEFPVTTPEVLHRLRARNAVTLASLEEAETCVAPTAWQRSTFPSFLQPRIAIAHEGIDVEALDRLAARPSAGARPLLTFLARHLEPHRGFHTFMRALPRIQASCPDLEIAVIGSDTGGYGAGPVSGRSWTAELMDEVGSELDRGRLTFTGPLPFSDYVGLVSRADIHVYLTYPFVLSWSALEAAALRRALVYSDTKPVSEFFTDRETARLVDMLDPDSLADAVEELYDDVRQRERLGGRARAAVFDRGLSREHGRAAWLAALGLGRSGPRRPARATTGGRP